MKKAEIVKSVNGLFSKTSFQLKKHSPEILVVAGVIGVVTSAVMACKATTKVNEILDKTSSMISAYLDNKTCSVLEMMIALAIRCEEHIMDDPDVGNRTGQWFWNMIVNLGLGSMNDSKFDRAYIEENVQRFLERKYSRNGAGGLFTVNHSRYDLRKLRSDDSRW